MLKQNTAHQATQIIKDTLHTRTHSATVHKYKKTCVTLFNILRNIHVHTFWYKLEEEEGLFLVLHCKQTKMYYCQYYTKLRIRTDIRVHFGDGGIALEPLLHVRVTFTYGFIRKKWREVCFTILFISYHITIILCCVSNQIHHARPDPLEAGEKLRWQAVFKYTTYRCSICAALVTL
jgi:hypothetical protein